MTKAKSLLATGILALFSATALRLPTAFRNLPSGCAHTIKADHQGNGEFEYEAELSGQRNSIPSLAKKSDRPRAQQRFPCG